MNKILQEITRNKKLMNLTEADISGVDELVYNPATRSSGDIGHGYKKGKKIQGLTWKDHENHLHISFTDRNVAMKVIDKADEMGLVTSENPYAKKDPNDVIDGGHVSTSLHYSNFPGLPLVGKAVDIRGDKNKIIQLINWVESTFVGKGAAISTSKSIQPIQNPKSEDENKLNNILGLTLKNIKISDLPNFLDNPEDAPDFLTALKNLVSLFT